MTGYYSNLALHVSEATLKGQRRLASEHRLHWGYIACAIVGAAAAWAVALAFI